MLLKYKDFSVDSTITYQTMLDLKIEVSPNTHGVLLMSGHAVGDGVRNEIDALSTNSCITIQALNSSLENDIIFQGLIQSAKLEEVNGLAKVTIRAKSGSIVLDTKHKSRSFQNVNMTYGAVIKEVLADTPKAAILFSVDENRKIGVPILQYEETDWEFIKRLASHFGTSVIADCLSPASRIAIGLPQSSKTLNFAGVHYAVCRCDKSIQFGLSPLDATHYTVTTTENGNIGDSAYINGHRFFICEKQTAFERGELIHTYILADKSFLFMPKAYNDNISGLSLCGTVVKTEKESVYIQLDIDKGKSNADYPFNWTPPTGNIMYCMPKLGTSASVHFPTNDEALARAVTSPRTSNTGEGFKNTSNRGIITEHGKQLDLYPGRMGFQGAGGCLNMVDETGVVLNSQSGITMVANGKINIKAPVVNISMPLEIQMHQSGKYVSAIAGAVVPIGTGVARVGVVASSSTALATMAAEASVSLCNQFDFIGGNGSRFYGCVYIQYNPFDDAPQEGDFSLLKSIVFAFLAAVAVVVCAAVLLGVGGIALLCVAAGACVVAGCMVYADNQSGNNRSFGEYLFGAVTGGVIGGFSYALATAALTVIPGITTLLQGVGGYYALPFLTNNAGVLASIGSVGFASFFGIQGTNTAFSMGLGKENALVDMLFGGTEYYDDALQVYNSFSMLGMMFGFVYIQIGAMYMPQNISEGTSGVIPKKVKDIVSKIKANNGTPPQGYKGGKVYQNNPVGSGQKLPEGINYKEYDVNPYIKGQDRGVERIVIGDDGSVWYTNNHYDTFTKLE